MNIGSLALWILTIFVFRSNCIQPNSIVRRRKVVSGIGAPISVRRQYGGIQPNYSTLDQSRIIRLRSLVKKKIKKIIKSRAEAQQDRDNTGNTLNPNVISNIENGQNKVQEVSNRLANKTLKSIGNLNHLKLFSGR